MILFRIIRMIAAWIPEDLRINLFGLRNHYPYILEAVDYGCVLMMIPSKVQPLSLHKLLQLPYLVLKSVEDFIPGVVHAVLFL